MELHELVSMRNSLLQAINLSPIDIVTSENIDRLNTIAAQADENFANKILSVANDHKQVYSFALAEVKKIDNIVQELNSVIDNLTTKFFTKNYQNELFVLDYNFIKTVKTMVLAPGAEHAILQRLYFSTSWKYPCLEICCREGYWTKHLTGFDPLYIADNFDEFIDAASSQFAPLYQSRLRKYKIKDFKIENLPKNQFGFIFSFDYFNYLSLDTIRQYLIQARDWLRPGGTLFFTYNNADLPASAGLCNGYFMSYVPKSMLIPLAESLGYIVMFTQDILPSTSWIELRKPGLLKTVKAHQALGEIKTY